MSAIRTASITELRAELACCTLADRERLGRRLRALRGDDGDSDARRRRLVADIAAAVARRAARAAALPRPTFPAELPVSDARERIANAIAAHPVVIVCGETGSGKTTQLPKICLELGRGVDGYIGHTQPRRVAARTVAARIAAELDSPPGELAGYKVRFDDRVAAGAYVKLMTDGLLLAEVAHDPRLLAYDTLIIDEAHERSLNVDLLLGYLKRLLPKRPDLRVILSSASIDTERFSRHFDDAPVIEVSGRTWPVEVRWRPDAGGGAQAALAERVRDGVAEALADGPGDVLVFLPGERDIRECAALLRRVLSAGVELLPLYARLAAARQDIVFAPHAGRRVVLATNVAETSITVPGVRYVVDTGLARIGRWSYRSRVQRLPVEPISKASAEQRKGRCGRVAAGVCIRLYDEQDYAARADFTDPEIIRANLTGVVLQMKALNLGDVEHFPFLDAPERRALHDAYRLLAELGALDAHRRITALGRRLARFPADPRLARIVLAGAEHGALTETLVIAAALSVQDVRERPPEAREEARRAQAVFRDGRSDFLSCLKLWIAIGERLRECTRREFERWCRDNYLAPTRVREWREVHRQLSEVAGTLGLRRNSEPAAPAVVHRALLSGLLDLVGKRGEQRDYIGVRGRRFRISQGSALARANPPWIMAAELVDTGRVYAHTVAAVKPRWLEAAAGSLLRREWLASEFDPASGEVIGWQRVTFGGLVLAARRRGWFGREHPRAAREIFIRSALVEGEAARLPEWAEYNLRQRGLVTERAVRERRDAPFDDAEALYEFYAERLPDEVHDEAGLRRWLRAQPARAAELRRDIADAADDAWRVAFPDCLEVGGALLPLRYRLQPGAEDDGITARVPLAMLNQIDARRFEWLVPGWLSEKVVSLLRCLPKSERREFVPAAQFAAEFVATHADTREGLAATLATWLSARCARAVSREVLETAVAGGDARLPAWLRMRFEVLHDDGEVLAASRDLRALQSRFSNRARQSFDALREDSQLEQGRDTDWSFGTLPMHVEVRQGEAQVRGYPALVDLGDAVAVRIFDDPGTAGRAHHEGLLRLFRLRLPRDTRQALKRPPAHQRLSLLYSLLPEPPPWLAPTLPDGAAGREPLESLARHVLQTVFAPDASTLRDAASFRAALAAGEDVVWPCLRDSAALLVEILQAHAECLAARREVARGASDPRVVDLETQLACLVPRGFLECIDTTLLRELPRYLRAASVRARRLRADAGRDHDRCRQLAPLLARWREAVERCTARGEAQPEALLRYRWMLEELRGSLFAQELGTRVPVSVQRLERQWLQVAQALGEAVTKA